MIHTTTYSDAEPNVRRSIVSGLCGVGFWALTKQRCGVKRENLRSISLASLAVSISATAMLGVSRAEAVIHTGTEACLQNYPCVVPPWESYSGEYEYGNCAKNLFAVDDCMCVTEDLGVYEYSHHWPCYQ